MVGESLNVGEPETVIDDVGKNVSDDVLVILGERECDSDNISDTEKLRVGLPSVKESVCVGEADSEISTEGDLLNHSDSEKVPDRLDVDVADPLAVNDSLAVIDAEGSAEGDLDHERDSDSVFDSD